MKKIFTLLLAGILTLGLAACGNSGAPAEPEAPAEYPVTVGDFVLNEAPTAGSIISLTPAITEMVFDLGYGDLLCGVSQYCDTPAAAAALPKMGSVYTPDLAAIKASGATVLITSVPLTEADLIDLQQSGFSILCLARADSVEGIKSNYESLAKVLGGNVSGKVKSDEVAVRIDNALATAKTTLSALTEPMDATLLIAYPYQMATGDTLEGRLLTEIGFTCSGALYTDWLYPEDELKALEPDVIFCANADDVETVAKSYEYKSVAAAKNGKITKVDFTAFERQSVRMFDALMEMASFAVSAE